MEESLQAHAKNLYTIMQKTADPNIDPKSIDTLFKKLWKPPYKKDKNTLTVSLQTQKKNERLGTEEDPYTAYLRVWEEDPEDVEPKTEGIKPLTVVLRRENSVLYDPEEEEKKRKKKAKSDQDPLPEKKVYIPEQCWMKLGIVLERLFINGTAFNYKITALDATLTQAPAINNGNPF